MTETCKYQYAICMKDNPLVSPDPNGYYPTREAAEKRIAEIVERNTALIGKLEVRD